VSTLSVPRTDGQQPRTVVATKKRESFQRKGKAGHSVARKPSMMTLTRNGFRIFVLNKPAPHAQSEVRRKLLWQRRTEEFCSGGRGVQQIQFRTEDRENGIWGR